MSMSREVEVETITETTEFANGAALWDWIVSSNPIVERLLAMLEVTGDERAVIRGALERIVRERSGGAGPVRLSNPVNVGVAVR